MVKKLAKKHVSFFLKNSFRLLKALKASIKSQKKKERKNQ